MRGEMIDRFHHFIQVSRFTRADSLETPRQSWVRSLSLNLYL